MDYFSTEVRVSPTKPCGKGSKRKQDELDEDDEEEGDHQTWVEALTQELAEEGPEEDPDYEVGACRVVSCDCTLCKGVHKTTLHTRHWYCICYRK